MIIQFDQIATWDKRPQQHGTEGELVLVSPERADNFIHLLIRKKGTPLVNPKPGVHHWEYEEIDATHLRLSPAVPFVSGLTTSDPWEIEYRVMDQPGCVRAHLFSHNPEMHRKHLECLKGR